MLATKPDFADRVAAFTADLTTRAKGIHSANVEAGWWSDKQGNRVERNMGEMLMLCVTEVSEASSAVSADLMDDHLPHREMIEVELADVEIRLLDICGSRGFDVGAVASALPRPLIPSYANMGALDRKPRTLIFLLRIVNALSVAMEGARKPDRIISIKGLGEFSALDVALARALLEVRTVGVLLHLDVAGAVDEKLAYNRQRADHKPENRFAPGGKVC